MNAKLLSSFGREFSFLLAVLCVGAASAAAEGGADFKSDSYAVAFDQTSPAFTWFSVDSLGRGKVSMNTVLTTGPANGPYELRSGANHRFSYVPRAAGKKATAVWEIGLVEKGMTLASRYSEGTPCPGFKLVVDQKKNHATLLGLLRKDGFIQLPAILHLPDQGTWRISSANATSLGYEASHGHVEITFTGATREIPALEYRCEVVSIYPEVAGMQADPDSTCCAAIG